MTSTQTQMQTAFAAVLILLTGLTLSLASCKERTVIIDKPDTPGEKVKDKIDDALDRRPNEKVRDAAEDIQDAAKDAKEGIKDAVEEAKDSVKDAAEN